MMKRTSTTIKEKLTTEIRDAILDEILLEYNRRQDHAEEIVGEIFGRKPYPDEVQEYIDGLGGMLDAAEIVYKYGREEENEDED